MLLATAPVLLPLPGTPVLPDLFDDVTAAGPLARAYVEAVRADLAEAHRRGERGVAVMATYSATVDRLITWLFDMAVRHFQARAPRLNPRCVVVAQGGYGRGELNPWSDIDLLILYPWKVNPFIETVGDVIVPTLWDASLAVGSAMRNVRECVRMAAADMKVRTALLDARFVCGDDGVWAEFDAGMQADVWRAPSRGFIEEKLAENVDRHARTGGSVYLLQPDLKEGRGGLRDIHTALWLAKVKFHVRTLRDLVALGELPERDVDEVETAVEFLMRVRNAMHFATGAHQDVLTFEMQDWVAPELGFGKERAGVEAFMRRYFQEASVVARVSDAVVSRSVRPPVSYRRSVPRRTVAEGMHIHGDVLSISGRDVVARDPAIVVGVFGEAQRHGVPIAEGTQALIRESLPLLTLAIDEPGPGAAFLRVVGADDGAADALVQMHRLGVLRTVIPEFAHLDGLVTRDPSHVYTVDEHSLAGVREIERLRLGESAADQPLLTQVAQQLSQPGLLVLGMLFHDIGKGQGSDHSGRGARMMETAGARLGLNVDEIAACAFLVQHHLLMSHLAQHRDIDDPDLVGEFCASVGTVENLQRLFVLTYADMRAVGPTVWNSWRGSLLTELYRRALERFERGLVEAEDPGARATRIRQRVSMAAGSKHAVVDRHLAHVPDRYVLGTPEETIPWHAELRARFEAREADGLHPAEVTAWRSHGELQFSELVICTRDRPGLFAMLSGVLAAHRLNIIAARIATSSDGIAIDTFRISHDDGVEPDEDRRDDVGATLREVLAGDIDVEVLVRHAQPAFVRGGGRRRPTEVTVHATATHTIIDVETTDRVGLLFTVTNCLYHEWVEIHLAKITTMVDRVLDVFYVTDNEGRRIDDPARIARLRSGLLAALDPPPGDGVSAETHP